MNFLILFLINDFYVFSTLPFLINYVYFWYSLIYLFGRTIIAQFMAANIYDSSLKPLELFQSIPCEGFCIEVFHLLYLLYHKYNIFQLIKDSKIH